jgi:hypothetical protein
MVWYTIPDLRLTSEIVTSVAVHIRVVGALHSSVMSDATHHTNLTHIHRSEGTRQHLLLPETETIPQFIETSIIF